MAQLGDRGAHGDALAGDEGHVDASVERAGAVRDGRAHGRQRRGGVVPRAGRRIAPVHPVAGPLEVVDAHGAEAGAALDEEDVEVAAHAGIVGRPAHAAGGSKVLSPLRKVPGATATTTG
jgi:hypothetical protein